MENVNNMKCDICKGNDLNEVLILKSDKWRYGEHKARKEVRRVCFRCARKLAYSGRYHFGYYWSCFLLSMKGVF